MKKGWIIILVAVMFNLFLFMQASAEVTTSINGELRLRPEFRDQADFNDARNDTQSFYGQRIRLGVNAKITPDLSGYVQLQDTRTWGNDLFTDTIGNTNQGVDIHQGFVLWNNLGGHPLGLKVGRQELNYGDQRLIGGFGWSNNGRAFDALKLMYATDMVDLDFWTAKVVEANSCNVTTSPAVGCALPTAGADEDTDFYGLYATFKTLIPDNNLQAYLLYNRNGSDANGNDEIDLSEYTLGARLAGKVSGVGIDYTGEVAYQLGDNGGSGGATTDKVDISAWALAVEAGYTIPATWSPRVAVEYDLASGSDDPTDEDNTFNNLFPTNHLHYGYMDYQAWMNMQDIVLKVSAKPSDKCWIYLAYHMFTLAEEADAWYGANGLPRPGFGASAANTEDEVGQELDLVARHTFNPNLKVEAGISQFFAGDFIESVVAESEDSTWAYIMGTVNFQ